MGTGFFRLGHCARPRIPNRRDTLLYEDEFELTYQVNLPSAVPSKALLDDLRERNGNLPILFTNPGDKDSL